MEHYSSRDIEVAVEGVTDAGLEEFLFQDPGLVAGPLTRRRTSRRRTSRRRTSRRRTSRRRTSRRRTSRRRTSRRRTSRRRTSRRRTSRRRTSRRRTSRRRTSRRRTSRRRTFLFDGTCQTNQSFRTHKRYWRDGNMVALVLTNSEN